MRKRIAFSFTASSLLIGIAAFEWQIIDIITPFLFFPLFISVWATFFLAIAFSLSCLGALKKQGKAVLLPISAQLLALAIVIFVPFTTIWLNIDFAMYSEERQRIVEDVNNKRLMPNVAHNGSLIRLSDKYGEVSRGGNEILVERSMNGLFYVFFFTYRGILDNYSGFLYVPEGAVPEDFSDLSDGLIQLIPFGDGWYYVSHS